MATKGRVVSLELDSIRLHLPLVADGAKQRSYSLLSLLRLPLLCLLEELLMAMIRAEVLNPDMAGCLYVAPRRGIPRAGR